MGQAPSSIQNEIQVIRRLQRLKSLTPHEERTLNHARLAVARWVCRQEGLPATIHNLAAVLGPDGATALELAKRGVVPEPKPAAPEPAPSQSAQPSDEAAQGAPDS